MNKHFEDAWYYLRRAGEHTAQGVREEFEPVERELRRRIGRERPTRTEKAREELETVERKAESRARRLARKARERVESL